MRLHRILFITLFCGIITLFAKAQEFGGGLIFGVSTSQVAGDMLGGFNKIGVMAGAFTNRRVKEKLQVQLEIVYIEKGSRNPNIHKNNIAEISLTYIEVPVRINLKQKENIGIEFGILPAFNISSAMNDNFSDIIIDPPFEKYDFGVFAGINYHLTEKIILNTRINSSIIPIRPHSSGATWGFNKGQYNTILSFALHYQII